MVYIVVLNWNNFEDTESCIQQLLEISGIDYTIILVDNYSTDGSREKLKSRFPQIELIENSGNFGFAKGNNSAIDLALQREAEYVWLINNDTVVNEDCLHNMIITAKSEEKVGAVGSVSYYMNENNKIQTWGGGKVNPFLGKCEVMQSQTNEAELDYISGVSILMNLTAVKEVGSLDNGYFMYWEDVDFGLRLKKYGWKLKVANDAVLHHKVSGSIEKNEKGVRSSKFDHLISESLVRFIFKFSPLPYITVFISFPFRILKRILSGNFEGAKAIFLGMRAGFQNKGKV